MRLSSVAALSSLVFTSACFNLERGEQLSGGVITGVVLDLDGAVADNAIVSIVDVARTAGTDADGRFRFEGVPAGIHTIKLVIDVDGDGRAEQGALRAADVDIVQGTLGGVDIGTVTLSPTGAVNGRVVDVDDVPVGAATVALWRRIDIVLGGGIDASPTPVPLDAAADVVTTTAPDGTFSITGLIVGGAELAAFDTVGATTTRASIPTSFQIPAEDSRDVGDQVVVAVAGTRRAKILFAAPVEGLVEIRLAPTGGIRPAEPTITASPTAPTGFVTFDVPVGVWDVDVDVGESRGRLLAQVAPPLAREASWGVVELVRGSRPGPVCGDGTIDTGEACDDGANNALAPDACRPDCTLPACGDTIVDERTEGCDDGAANGPGAACLDDCTLNACGNAVVDEGEACDFGDANGDLATGCHEDCTAVVCGDGVVEGLETCERTTASPTTCVPADGASTCDFCDSGCRKVVVDAKATIVVEAKSRQGWEQQPMSGVPVSRGGVTTKTDLDGRAVFEVTLPIGTAPFVVGGVNVDEPTYATIVQRLPPPPSVSHGARVVLEARLYEGSVLTKADFNPFPPLFLGRGPVPGGDDTEEDYSVDFATNGAFPQSFFFSAGASFLGPDGQPTSQWRARIVVAPTHTADPRQFAAFPETIDDTGAQLACTELFDFQLEDGVEVDTAGTPIRVASEAASFGAGAWRFDDARGRFVRDLDASDGETFTIRASGLWCFGKVVGEPQEGEGGDVPTAGCATFTVRDEARSVVVGAEIEVVVRSEFSSGFVVRRTLSAADATCLEVPHGSITVGVRAPDGRIATLNEVEFSGLSTCSDGDCQAISVTLPAAPLESCLVITPVLRQRTDFALAPVPPRRSLILEEETDRGPINRGRIPAAPRERERCVGVANSPQRLRVTYPDIDDDCVEGVGSTQSRREFTIDLSDQSPSDAPPTCSVDGDDCSRFDLDFFCGSS